MAQPYYQDENVVIYNADCRDVLPTLEPVDLVLTDPPYGIGMAYGTTYNDDPMAYWEWFKPVISLMRSKSPNVVFTHRQAALREITDWDWCAVWHKPLALGFSQKGWLNHWEPIFIYGKPVATMGASNRPATPDVFSFNPEKPIVEGHPAPKPLALMKKLTEIFDPATIIDPFMGSGTTLRAAKDLGRKAIGIEIEERYCEIAAKRMSQLAMDLASA